jgi:hypothetical protein
MDSSNRAKKIIITDQTPPRQLMKTMTIKGHLTGCPLIPIINDVATSGLGEKSSPTLAGIRIDERLLEIRW